MPDEPVQGGQEGVEAEAVRSLGLPALKHQRVEGRRAVVGGGETILVCHCLHHLRTERERERLETEAGQMVRGVLCNGLT